MKKKFSLVLAMDKNRGVGFRGGLPWRLKRDMAFFKSITTSREPSITEAEFGIVRNQPVGPKKFADHPNAVIMGRRTWDSIPQKFQPLKDRANLILSQSLSVVPSHPEVKVMGSLESALAWCAEASREVYVIGGANVYAQCLEHPGCQRIYLTQIKSEFECDAFMPKLPPAFDLAGESPQFFEGPIPFSFQVWERPPG